MGESEGTGEERGRVGGSRLGARQGLGAHLGHMDGVLSRDLRALGIVELVTQRAAPRGELWLGLGLGLGLELG